MKITISIECDNEVEAQRLLQQLHGARYSVPPAPAPAPEPAIDVLSLRHTNAVPFIHGGLDDQPLRFGKHKGTTPRQLLDANPQYLLWCEENLEWPACTSECANYARELLGMPKVPKVPTLSPAAPPTSDPFNDDIPF